MHSPRTRRALKLALSWTLPTILLTACASPSQSPTPTTAAAAKPAAAAASPAAASPVASLAAASPVASPAAAPKPAAASSPSPSPSPAPVVAAVPPGGVRLDLVPDTNEVRFRVREQFAGRSLPNDAVGRTRAVTGAIHLDSQGRILGEQSKITTDLRTLQSDEARRDRFIRENTLETDEFPLAEFSPKEARGLSWPLPTSGEATFQLDGDLTVHGVTRPTTWETTARFTDQEVSGTANTRVTITEFGMQIPRVTLILSIDDDARLEMDFRATRR